MADEFLKQSLIAELDRSRGDVSAQTVHLKEDLAFGKKIRRGVSRSPAVWIGGAVLVGVILSRLPARQKKVKVKVGSRDSEETAKAGLAAVVLLPTLKFLFSTFQPALMAWVRGQMAPTRRA